MNTQRYTVSTSGTVTNSKTGRVLKLQSYSGYMYVKLNGVKHRVHRLVALAHISNPHNYPEIDHINEDKTDNRVENLRWCTSAMNRMYYQFGRCTHSYSKRQRGDKTPSKTIVVNGVTHASIYSAAKLIAKETEKNFDTIRKELSKFMKGKRPEWSMYGLYRIES